MRDCNKKTEGCFAGTPARQLVAGTPGGCRNTMFYGGRQKMDIELSRAPRSINSGDDVNANIAWVIVL
jgi:hypothetical protein